MLLNHLNVKLPDDSRKLQNMQHVVGGTYNIMLVLMGVLFGTGNQVMGIVMAVLTFMASRLSSEISYQTSIRVIQECTTNAMNAVNFTNETEVTVRKKEHGKE